MADHLIQFLANQTWMKVLRVLVMSDRPKCLREIVDLSGISLGGVQDVLRRLEESQVIVGKRDSNKILFSLSVSQAETKMLREIVNVALRTELQSRAERYSKKREKIIGWIDETVSTWQRGRRQLRDTT